jgi:hypothetical protein
MNVRITAFFPNQANSEYARAELRKQGINASPSSAKAPTVQLSTEEHNHNRRMFISGLIGASIGCLLGILAVNRVEGREMMYTVIVPMSLTYWGLALGLFVAMGIQHYRMVFGLMEAPEDLTLAESEGQSSMSVIVPDVSMAKTVQEKMQAFGARAFNLDMTDDPATNAELPPAFNTMALSA